MGVSYRPWAAALMCCYGLTFVSPRNSRFPMGWCLEVGPLGGDQVMRGISALMKETPRAPWPFPPCEATVRRWLWARKQVLTNAESVGPWSWTFFLQNWEIQSPVVYKPPSLRCSVSALNLVGRLWKLRKVSSSFLHHMDEKVAICGAQLFSTLQQSGHAGETLGSKAWESDIKSGPLLSETTHLSTKALCVCAKSLQSCPTLWNSMDSSLPGSSVHGILWAKTLEWVAMPSSKGSSQPRDLLCLLHWSVCSLPLALPGKPHMNQIRKETISLDIPLHAFRACQERGHRRALWQMELPGPGF